MFNYLEEKERLERAIKVFRHASLNSEFYSNKFSNVKEIKSYQDWLKLPFLTRTELYNNSYPKTKSMLTQPVEGVVVVSTGGSSGIARYGVLTYEEYKSFIKVQAEALKLLGVNKKDIAANLFIAGHLWPSFFSTADVFEEIGAVHLPISFNIDVESIIRYMFEFKPNVLIGLPTGFVLIADKLKAMGLKPDFVTFIGYAGEYLSPVIKKYLGKTFVNAEIYALAYTSGDCGLMGYQCENCAPNEYHLPTDFQYIEIYDFEREKVCGVEEPGEVIVTNLARFSQPIIRYRIGDMAAWKKGECKCGDKNPVFVLQGRAGADFKLGGEYISLASIEKALSPFFSIDGVSTNYQLEIEDLAGEKEKLKLLLKLESSKPELFVKHIDSIKKAVRNEIPSLNEGVKMEFIDFEVEFVELGKLDRSPITGKIKHLKDKRTGGINEIS